MELHITLSSTKPFQMIHLDTVTLENSKFLTIIVSYSKYAQSYLINSSHGIEIANKLVRYLTHDRIPEQIISDNGLWFVNY